MALDAVSNLAVFALLGGLFYFGHHTGWKLPRAAELIGETAAAPDDWCPEHLVPESQCVECHPDLWPRREEFGFCREHGVAECVIHHPQLAQVKGEPQLPKYDTRQAIALVPRPENNSRNTLHQRVVQFASERSIEKAGIDVDVVQERPMTDAIAANGQLTFDPNRVAHLSSRVPGTIVAVYKSLGDNVQAGEMLALVDAGQVGLAKSQFLQTLVQLQLRKTTVERLRALGTSGAVPTKSLIDAEAALQEADIACLAARQALANLGFEIPEDLGAKDAKQIADDLRLLGIPSSLATALPPGNRTANLIPIRAPHSGSIIVADVVSGEVVDTTSKLFTIADPQRLWLLLNVREEDARHVAVGLPVRFRTDDGLQEVTSTVAWISPRVDEHTRTLQVRVELAHRAGTLRDQSFGTGQIILREEPLAVVVPREAVQSTGDAHFVFVRDKNYFTEGSPKLFHVRQVRLGARDNKYVELLAGALPGEVVATKGSSVLLGQLLRSSLGEGCGCHED